MYFAQGIQLGLMMVALPAFMASNGVSATEIGAFIGTIMLPWSLKLLSAPIMDRFSFLPMGRRRPWVILGLVGASLGYLAMGMVKDPFDYMFPLVAAAFCVSVCTAFMDVAIDGMAIEILPDDEQSRANAYMWGGKVAGSAATTAGAAWTLNAYGMSITFFVAAFFTFLFALLIFAIKERPGEKIFPWSKGQASAEAINAQLKGLGDIGRKFLKVFVLPSSLLLAFAGFLHGITYGLFDAIMPVLTIQDLGWLDTGYSNLAALAGLIAGVIGMAVGGPLLEFLGRLKGMKLFLAALCLVAVVMGMGVAYWEHKIVVQSFVVLIYINRTLILIAIFATAMAFCWKPIAATQFATYMALMNLGISVGAPLLGPLSMFLSNAQIFFVLGFVAAMAILVLQFINVEKHLEHIDRIPAVNEAQIEIST
jgi:PAT family beta-lactamase induction signal transducer AmpG